MGTTNSVAEPESVRLAREHYEDVLDKPYARNGEKREAYMAYLRAKEVARTPLREQPKPARQGLQEAEAAYLSAEKALGVAYSRGNEKAILRAAIAVEAATRRVFLLRYDPMVSDTYH